MVVAVVVSASRPDGVGVHRIRTRNQKPRGVNKKCCCHYGQWINIEQSIAPKPNRRTTRRTTAEPSESVVPSKIPARYQQKSAKAKQNPLGHLSQENKSNKSNQTIKPPTNNYNHQTTQPSNYPINHPISKQKIHINIQQTNHIMQTIQQIQKQQTINH